MYIHAGVFNEYIAHASYVVYTREICKYINGYMNSSVPNTVYVWLHVVLCHGLSCYVML